MRRSLGLVLIIILIFGAAIFASWQSEKAQYDTEQSAKEEKNASVEHQKVDFEDTKELDNTPLRDVDSLYSEDDPYDVVTMYLTVSTGNAADGTDHTWAEVNEHSAYYYEEKGIDRYRVAGLLQVGDENGPVKGKLGYGQNIPNATVQIRGQTSTRNKQKNYKIKLVDNSKGWNDQRTIALNKHVSDGMRFRNKLAYDLMSGIPQIMALRTQFVHLYVKDTTEGGNGKFKDYGLYTQVEQLNRRAMRAHGLDKNGQLYKINYFEFFKYEDTVMTVDNPKYDKTAFESLLEIKSNEDHSKLMAMLDDINNYSLGNDEVIDKWFDRENLAYWMAYMMIMGNSDTENRNMYIYSPLNGNKWYIIPWDNDAMLMKSEDELMNYVDFEDWQTGISNYWGNVLFKRALLSKAFREELINAADDLINNYLTEDKIKARVNQYKKITKKYLYQMPDMEHARLTQSQYDLIADQLTKEPLANYNTFKESLNRPMPFYIDVPSTKNGTFSVKWENAVDLNGEDVKYHIVLAKDYNFKDKIFEEKNIELPDYSKKLKLKPGQYFLHVDATNESGKTINCFDYYTNTDGKIYGTYSFWIKKNGDVEIYEDEE